MNKYEVLEMIDEGAYGIVLKGRNRQTGELVAIKKFKDLEDDEVILKGIQRQVKMLRRLRSPYVVQLKEAFRRKGRVYLVFEYMQRNVLHLLEASSGGLQSSFIQNIIYQSVRALFFLHSQNVAHRDVKPENLLVNMTGSAGGNSMQLKICDFGFTRFLNDSAGGNLTDYVATRWYRSPELLVRDGYGLQVDMWAIGCIMGELFDGDPMFPGENEIDQLFLIMKMIGPLTSHQQQCLQRNFKGVRFPPIRTRQSLEMKYVGKLNDDEISFMKECLKMDPDERMTAEQALRHPYLASFTGSVQSQEQSLQSTLMIDGTHDDYDRASYRQPVHKVQHTPRLMEQIDFRSIHHSVEQPSYLISRHSKNQQSVATLKPREELRVERKDITHKVQLQLFPNQLLLKRGNSEAGQLKTQRVPSKPILFESRGSLQTRLRLPPPSTIVNHIPTLMEINGNGKQTISKIEITKRTLLQTKSNSQPYMSLQVPQQKRFRVLKKSQELRLGQSLSRPQLPKPHMNF